MAFFLGELLLYDCTVTEEVFKLSEEELTALYLRRQPVITEVKKQVMEYLEDVEQARHFVEEANKLDLEETAAELDPENEQENVEIGEAEEHPDYEHLNPGEEEQERAPNIFRRIEVPDPKLLKERTLGLDKFQRIPVDIVVKYA